MFLQRAAALEGLEMDAGWLISLMMVSAVDMASAARVNVGFDVPMLGILPEPVRKRFG
jgi:hypothetical protein